MKAIAATPPTIQKPINKKKIEVKPKVKMGTLKDLVYISETIFDDDLR